MPLTLKDLLVVIGNDQFDEGVLVATEERQATLGDLVEVLKQEGAETVWWCEPHAVGEPQQASRCWRGAVAADLEERTPACRMTERLVLPLGDTP